jgi:hypothetical protein
MYVSYQIQRMQAAETMTTAQRRQTDDQLGTLAADVLRLGQRIAGPARSLGRATARGAAIGRYVSKESRRSPALPDSNMCCQVTSLPRR